MKKLQLFLSHNGISSRRKAFELIQRGRVTVNEHIIVEPSKMINEVKDRVAVDGKPVGIKEYEYVMFYKPTGYITTMSQQHKSQTIYDILPESIHHLKPVGRLDKNSEGLLLLTNDGDLAYKLTHPKFDLNKIYVVRIGGTLNKEQKWRLENGIKLEGKKTAPAVIRHIKKLDEGSEFTIAIHEGRKRQVRLMVQHVGHHVHALKRVQQGPLLLGDLKYGTHRHLTEEELDALSEALM